MRTLIVGSANANLVIGKLQGMLSALGGLPESAVASFDNAESECVQTGPELVIVVLAGNPGSELEVIRCLRHRFEGHLLAVGRVEDPKIILRSLQMGATLFLDEAELETEFEASLLRLLGGSEASMPQGRLLGILSASGGCGASTLAVNLAAIKAREREKCILIDLNPGRGDLAALLDLKPQYSLADVCRNQARLDQAMLGKCLVRHTCGISLLASPPDYPDAGLLTPAGIRHALSLARKLFPYTIVDLEDCFHTEQVEVLKQATGILVVCRLDFTSLRNTRRVLDHLIRLDVQRHQVKVVVNQHGQPNELPIEEAEDALGEKLTSFIPYDSKTINLANNVGFPAVLKAPGTRLASSINELARLDFSGHRKSSSSLLPSLKTLLAGVFHGKR